jgi:hypothetical protein
MPKATLSFNLPEEREEYNTVNKASEMSSALWEIRQELFRPARKHGYSDFELTALIKKINSKFKDECVAEELIGLLEDRFSMICSNNDVSEFT